MHDESPRDPDSRDREKSPRGRLRAALGPNPTFDYKDVRTLAYFITERGKLVPHRVSGLSARQQRELARAVKLARGIALLPHTTSEGGGGGS